MRLPSIPIRIVAAALLLALGLAGLVVREGVARAQGQEVRLAITGYDPRSLLTGHYVQFRLAEAAPSQQACRPVDQRIEAAPGGWLAVRGTEGGHRIVASAPSRAMASRLGDLALRGETTCYGIVPRRGEPADASPATVSHDIGVDRIHLEQDEAETLEQILRGRDGPPPPSWAVLSVGRDGKARLKGLVVGDRRVDLDWF